MTDRFERAVLEAADRLARDPRTRPMLTAAVWTAQQRSMQPRPPQMTPITSLGVCPITIVVGPVESRRINS